MKETIISTMKVKLEVELGEEIKHLMELMEEYIALKKAEDPETHEKG